MADKKGHLSWETFLAPAKTSTALQDALVAQLEKDFRCTFSRPYHPQTLRTEVAEVVARHVQNGTLSALLYRIDVSEQKARECFSQHGPVYAVALAILQREAQKVLFRSQYSGTGTDRKKKGR